MTQRIVSVGDDFALPPGTKVLDTHLPTRLSAGELSATYGPSAAPMKAAIATATKQRIKNSRLVVPGAPFGALHVHSTATVSEGDSSIATAGSVNRFFTASPTSPYMALTMGGGFAQNTNSPFGWSASHVPPTSGWGSRRNFRVSVGTDAAAIIFRISKGNTPPPVYRVRVDGKFVGSQLAVTPSGAAGATRFIRVDFPAAGRRRVELELGGCDIEGVYIPQTGSVWAAPPKGPKAICVGDSYTESSGDYTNMDSWVTAFADTMGWENVWNSGIGSTGWAKESATGANNSIEDRVAVTVNAYSPDVVFFLAGYNDRAVDSAPYTTTKNAVTAALSSVRAALPDALIIVGLNTAHSPVDGSVDTVYKPIQDAINASAGPYADILLDTASAGLFTGSGTTSAPSGSGNSDVYLDVTNHPMKAGQRYLGQRLAHMVINQLTAL